MPFAAKRYLALALVTAFGLISTPAFFAQSSIGIFEGQQDVGTLLHPGTAHYDSDKHSYEVSGSGANMWFGTDDFHFVWKRISGDVALSADIAFVGDKGNNHRKAALLLRQSLEPGSIYADVALHGDGLTSLQYRDAAGADTHEVESAVSAPRRVRIEKRGQEVFVFVGDSEGRLAYSGASMRTSVNGDFYVGLGVCSHDKDTTERVLFSNVSVEALSAAPEASTLWSTLETVKIASTDRLIAYTSTGKIDGVSWAKDGASLLFSRDHRVFKAVLGYKGAPQPLPASAPPTDALAESNSPDGKWRAFFAPDVTELRIRSLSDQTVKVLAKLNNIPDTSNTLFWSPDSSRIAFVNFSKLPQ